MPAPQTPGRAAIPATWLPWRMDKRGLPYLQCGPCGPVFGPVVMTGSQAEMVACARVMAAAHDLLALLHEIFGYAKDAPPDLQSRVAKALAEAGCGS